VQGAVKETGNEALSFSLGAASKNRPCWMHHFYIKMQEAMAEDGFLHLFVFNDEYTFHFSGKVHRHNVRRWGTEHPHVIVQQERASWKNVLCVTSTRKVYGPLFFHDDTVMGTSYLPHRHIGWGDHGDLIFCPWPCMTPNLIPCDYFLWGYVKDEVFVLLLPASIPDLQSLISASLETVKSDVLIKLARIRLPPGCVSCNQGCTHWTLIGYVL
jgi:hypothetical protein